MANEMVKFTKLRTSIDPNFWAKFAELKLDKYKLDEKIEISVWGSYSSDKTKRCPLLLDCTSFNENVETTTHNGTVPCSGYLINTNTFESFRQMQPEKFIDTIGKHLLNSIKDGTALEDPSKLTLFLLLSHADLKKYRFHYWAAYPTPFSIPEMFHQSEPQLFASKYSKAITEKLKNEFNELEPKSKCFFTVLVTPDDVKILPLSEGVKLAKSPKVDSKKLMFGFFDTCESEAPGWPLRNLMCLLFWSCPDYSFSNAINILSYRGDRSMVYQVQVKAGIDRQASVDRIFEGRMVGWEANASGKMGPNIADLSQTMDPTKMAERAVDLNLKLMKWRLVPDLNLDDVSKLRCLLLGAGTLGCSVARVLIGWGIKNITFVDNSTVSHSNTVRQSLYTHEDAVKRKLKAEAAKEALLRISPNFNVEGVVLQIPMPGHVVGQSMVESTRSAVKTLEELVGKHDVVFLLLDSREARWLPTLLCAAHDKIAINAALGFDSYTVQRHGTRRQNTPPSSPDLTVRYPAGKDLGCYFCNDVTQPGNSQVDRTLDQQCTVSRPGLSSIAAGLAVELMVGITQHSKGIDANAYVEDGKGQNRSERETCEGLLGTVPHTIRGSLWSHEMRLTITHRFPSCTACSVPLINEYRKRGFDFILDACNQPNYLERLAGLEDLLKNPNLDELCYAIDSSSDEDDENISLSKV